MSTEVKNSIAKFATLVWFGFLIFVAFLLVKMAIRFDLNVFLGSSGADVLPKAMVMEGKMILFIVAMSIFGGVSFAIRVFYTSVRYANIYDQAYGDYRGKNITFEQFQKLVRVEMYIERFNYTWFISFVTQPFGSVFLGIICYFIARSGLGFVSGIGELTVQSIYMYGVLSFLTGFYSNKFVEWLDHLSDKIFSKDFIDQKTNYKQQILEVTNNDTQGLKNDINSSNPVINTPQTSSDSDNSFSLDMATYPEDGNIDNNSQTLADTLTTPLASSLPETNSQNVQMKMIR